MPNRRLTKAEHARRFARALTDTSTRYLYGMMGYRTWQTHMQHLWAQAATHGVVDRVKKELGL